LVSFSVVVTDTSQSVDEFNRDSDFVFSGDGADDYVASPDLTCLTGEETIRLNPEDACKIDLFFTPRTLGSRPATFGIDDTLNSRATVTLSGTRGIGYYQVSSHGAVATSAMLSTTAMRPTSRSTIRSSALPRLVMTEGIGWSSPMAGSSTRATPGCSVPLAPCI
jgi:hypothetical protein